MTVEDLQAICKKFKGVTEDIKWEDHLCFNIGGKMFLVTAPDSTPCSASFKVPEEDFEEISSKAGFSKHKYIGRYFWVQLDDINRVSRKQWEKYARQSYELVASKLSGKLKKQLGIA
jgi:predicted DNA-binding protein (MmcQ/YjbR family)